MKTYNEIKLKNLLTGKIATSSPDYPLFNHESYKIQVSINDEAYVHSYRRSARWDFGDGTVMEGPSAIHHYSKPGRYTIRCTLYRINRDIVENEVQPIDVIVKETIPTELSFIDPVAWTAMRGVCINNKLGFLQITAGSNVVSEPKISAYQRNSEEHQNYFDICSESMYHLKRYWTFLQEETVYYSNGEYAKTILKPTQTYTPSYIPLYGRFVSNEGIIKLETYAVAPSDNKIIEKCALQPYAADSLDGSRVKDFQIIRKDRLSEVPEGCTEIGKVGIAEVWYKNDYYGEHELFFEIKKDTLQLSHEPGSVENYLNIPPLGMTAAVNDDFPGGDYLTLMTTAGFEEKTTNYSTFSDIIRHNFYKNYAVEGIWATYILNDSLNGERTFNLLKAPDGRPSLLEETSEYDGTGCKVVLKEDGDYYLRYEITPLESNFIIREKDGGVIYRHGKLVDLDELVVPSEKIKNENIDELLDAYMQHPMFENTHNLKTLLHDIFANKNILSYLTSKGANFIDDNVNHKTCYVDKLLSILDMLDSSVSRYDVAAFEKVNELRDLTRILTMNYSDLFGTVLEDEYDIEANKAHLGKNIGDKVAVKDTIYCNEKYEIIGFKTVDGIYQLPKPSPHIVVKDNITFKTHLVSFYGIEDLEFEDFSGQSEEWKERNDDFMNAVAHSYSISDYDYRWGWNLNLPENAQKSVYKYEQIAAAYSFYIFVPVVEKKRRYNFVSEETIPSSSKNSEEQISVEEWNEDFGFTYDCLMKVLTQNLK